jgi:hypothetical protein
LWLTCIADAAGAFPSNCSGFLSQPERVEDILFYLEELYREAFTSKAVSVFFSELTLF